MSFRDALWVYIATHPDATPEEILAVMGVPFDKDLWNLTLEAIPGAVKHLQQSPNPNDRKNWRFRRDG